MGARGRGHTLSSRSFCTGGNDASVFQKDPKSMTEWAEGIDTRDCPADGLPVPQTQLLVPSDTETQLIAPLKEFTSVL